MKLEKIFENTLISRDTSIVGRMADQLARAAYIENRGNLEKAKQAIEAAAENTRTALLQKADVILQQLIMKEVK